MIELNKEKFEQLAEIHDPHCVSIFIPTHRAGQEVKEGLDQRGLKNQIKEAKKQLASYKMNNKDIDEYLKPVEDLLNDQGFWNYQSDGLAVFLSKKSFDYFTLPVTFEAFTYVDDHFYLKPLVPVLDQDRKYYLLALSLQEVRLFEAYPYELIEKDVEGLLPERLEDVVGYDYRQKHQEFREGQTTFNKGMFKSRGGTVSSNDSASSDQGKTMFHGHGAGKDDKKDEILKFFRAVNEGVMEELHDKKAPLILASVDYLIPIYKEANDYKYLHDEHITGNPEYADLMVLHEKAMDLLQEHLNSEKNKKKEIFEQALSNKKASYDEREIVPAAINGRIDTLFIRNRESLWGVFDKKTNAIKTDDQETMNNSDLLNIAAIQTILHNGNVYLTDTEEMPESTSKLNAILRF